MELNKEINLLFKDYDSYQEILTYLDLKSIFNLLLVSSFCNSLTKPIFKEKTGEMRYNIYRMPHHDDPFFNWVGKYSYGSFYHKGGQAFPHYLCGEIYNYDANYDNL